jgi:hypothetical protein
VNEIRVYLWLVSLAEETPRIGFGSELVEIEPEHPAGIGIRGHGFLLCAPVSEQQAT